MLLMSLKLNENDSHNIRNILFKKNKREKKSGRQEFQMLSRKPRRLDNSGRKEICAEIFVNWVGWIGEYGPAVLSPG